VGNPPNEDPEQVAEAPSLEYLFEQALRGDNEALRHFMTLINTKHYKLITQRLRGLKTGAGNATVEDIFQDTVINLMEKLQDGEIKDLKDDDRKDILEYFQKLCNGRLKDAVRKRKSPALERHKTKIPEQFPDRSVKIPGEQRYTEHLSLIDYAASRLSPEHAAILKMYRDEVPYAEMARITGKKEETLRNLIARLKNELQLKIVPRSETAALHFERGRSQPLPDQPTWAQIDAVVALMPPEIGEAVRFVHVERHTVEELGRSLGVQGSEKAKARLVQAYQTLRGRLKFPFPDCFQMVGPRPGSRQLTRREIEAAVDKLPAAIKDAFLFVHVEGHTVEELAEKIGDDETHRAQGRLDDAYRVLSLRLNDDFPDAYERALDG
jgi:RNA polymerase sigma factor (sigma-70 family)